MNNSIKFKRRLNHFLTYFYLVALSIIIIYPLLITITSAFKTGNVLAFKLDTDINFSLENFSKLFTETLYGTWYFNTLIIAILTMIIQTSIVVLAGYAYSRYKKTKSGLFLNHSNGANDGCPDRLLRYGFDVKCAQPQLVPHLPLCRRWYPNERLAHERIF